ncbi:hypothetical protein EDC44_1272 [Cricetibacter osteomyelitidis]|uniref:Cytoplasmic protein n=1 Tax=Cricetibacter osteomyelitidis TaxID=1521931 RepID=A0A4R2STP2_9PAST|nr:ClbS/DfsB family four-helix bundle protein [Cricetibacter osteomyelitidis]TCP92091.1 hypothetical protein EDC44_1272 [Cricetibacter osteomyelitidis]
MKSYTDGAALVAAIQAALDKYLVEFADVPEVLKDVRVLVNEKTPSEHLSYQLGWVNLLLQWEKNEQAGKVTCVPAEGYRWNQLGELYQHFYASYGKYSLFEQQDMLRDAVTELCGWVEGLSEAELFQSGQRQWADTPAKWPLWKWVHINTVAPFTNFRSKIRKWKKMALSGD